MKRALAVAAVLAGCGSDDGPTDVTCHPIPVYLNRTGGTYKSGSHDDAASNVSVLVDSERTLAPWPMSQTDWTELVDCVKTALIQLPRLQVTEQDPGNVEHVEIVFTDSYWAGLATTNIVPATCTTTNQIEFVFGNAVPTAARACHLAMQGFALMTAKLSYTSECHDFVNNAQDCSTTRAFLDQSVDCVDTSNQAAACRCDSGATTQNTYAELADRFPECP